MSLLERITNNLAGFDSHDIQGLGTVNIRKPGLDDLEKIQSVEGNEDDASSSDVKAMARMIGLNFIVNEKCEPEFNEGNIETFVEKVPMETHIEIIGAFKQSFSKLQTRMDELSKKP